MSGIDTGLNQYEREIRYEDLKVSIECSLLGNGLGYAIFTSVEFTERVMF